MNNRDAFELIQEMDRLFLIAERSGIPEDWTSYHALRDAVAAALGLDCPGTAADATGRDAA